MFCFPKVYALDRCGIWHVANLIIVKFLEPDTLAIVILKRGMEYSLSLFVRKKRIGNRSIGQKNRSNSIIHRNERFFQ